MIFFDYILILILIFSFIISYYRGFIKEVLSILKWILSFYISISFCKNFSDIFLNYISDPLLSNIFSFIFLFIIIFIMANIIAKLLTNFLKFIGLGSLNNLLGGILGVGKSIIIILIFTILISTTDMIKQNFITQSLSYPYFKNIIESIIPYMPYFIKNNNKMFSNT